jgi:hypothetical protein
VSEPLVETASAVRRRPRRPLLLLVSTLLLVVLAIVAGWIALRGLAARDQLLGALPLARSIQTQLAQGDTDIAQSLDELQKRTSIARELTSDPVWRAVEFVPWAGQNLRAFREVAAMVNDVATDALPPLGELASTISLASLTPQNGAIDLQPLRDAGPALGEAARVLQAADEQASAIDTAGAIPQIRDSVDRLVGLIGEVADVVSGLDIAAQLLPDMLGGNEPRQYLFLFQNNAEVRAGGGMAGAISTLQADGGALSMIDQVTAASVGEFISPPASLTDAEQTLYGDALGVYLQNVTATPEFSRSAQLAQAMWQERRDVRVDGVIGLDVRALEGILVATGPVMLAGDVELTSENAVQVLLSDVYLQIADPVQQDEFFADAARRIFEAVTSGSADPGLLVEALVNAAGNQRLVVWSDRADEQIVLERVDLDGGLPVSTPELTRFGVYLNDATGAKMDYYLDAAISLGAAVCRSDERPYYRVAVRVQNTAPADAAVSLPVSVTGPGTFGVPRGMIRTNIFIYGPPESIAYDVRLDGVSIAFVSTTHNDLTVAGATVDLEPGDMGQLEVLFLGATGSATRVDVEHTTLPGSVLVSANSPVDCGDVAPSGDTEVEASGAVYPNEALGLSGRDGRIANSEI